MSVILAAELIVPNWQNVSGKILLWRADHIFPLEVVAPFHQRCRASIVALLSSLEGEIALALNRNSLGVFVWFPVKINNKCVIYLHEFFPFLICLFPYLSTSFLQDYLWALSLFSTRFEIITRPLWPIKKILSMHKKMKLAYLKKKKK